MVSETSDRALAGAQLALRSSVSSFWNRDRGTGKNNIREPDVVAERCERHTLSELVGQCEINNLAVYRQRIRGRARPCWPQIIPKKGADDRDDNQEKPPPDQAAGNSRIRTHARIERSAFRSPREKLKKFTYTVN